MVRRVRLISGLCGEGENEWYLAMLPEAKKDVRVELITALGMCRENVQVLLDPCRREKGKAKEAALRSLTAMETRVHGNSGKWRLGKSRTACSVWRVCAAELPQVWRLFPSGRWWRARPKPSFPDLRFDGGRQPGISAPAAGGDEGRWGHRDCAAGDSGRGKPCYDEQTARWFVGMGIPCFVCTPEKLPQLLKRAMKGQNLEGRKFTIFPEKGPLYRWSVAKSAAPGLQ